MHTQQVRRSSPREKKVVLTLFLWPPLLLVKHLASLHPVAARTVLRDNHQLRMQRLRKPQQMDSLYVLRRSLSLPKLLQPLLVNSLPSASQEVTSLGRKPGDPRKEGSAKGLATSRLRTTIFFSRQQSTRPRRRNTHCTSSRNRRSSESRRSRMRTRFPAHPATKSCNALQ